MPVVMRTWIVCVVVAWTGAALAAPRPRAGSSPATTSASKAAPKGDARAKHRAAVKLYESGDAEKALAAIEEGLAVAPKNLDLLGLKGRVLFNLRDYPGALVAYQAYLDAGATGANRREVQKIVDILQAANTTFLDITLAGGRAAIYLDSKAQGVFCTAAPACHRSILPGQYKVIAEQPGFERWTQPVTVDKNQTAKLTITLVEKPSLLTVRVAQPGARVTVDDAAHEAGTKVAAGSHKIVVSLAGHKEERREVSAHEGKPVELDIALTPLVPLHVEPAGAALVLDDRPAAIEEGGLAVPPGAHVLVARARGFEDRRVEIPADRPADYQIAIELPRIVVAVAPPAASRFTRRRKIAVAAGAAGVVAVATGVVLGVSAKHLEDDAFALCPAPSTPCAGARKADDLIVRGQSRAQQANIAFGVAGGAAITAAVLWLTGAPESRVAVTPRVGTVAGLDLAVRF